MEGILGVTMRWVHISSAVVLLGGLFLIRFGLSEDSRHAFAAQLAARFRPWMWAAFLLLLASGLYNLFAKESYPRGYHIWFGIKFLLALHTFAVSLLATRRDAPVTRRMRWLSGALVPGFLLLGVSAWLRAMSLGAR